MTEIANPHDKFFKEIITDKENALDFIQAVLPENLCKNFDFSTLAIDNNSYVDEELRENFSDVIYNCEYKNKNNVKITLLFEHKSYNVKYPRLQILRYMLNIWNTAEKQRKELTPVIPIVLYHGKEEWNSKPLCDYFPYLDDTLKCYIPEFDYLLLDLSRYSDKEIRDNLFKRAILETAMLLMKNIFDEEKLENNLENYLEISKLYLNEEKGLKFLKSFILYIYNAGDMEVDTIIEKVSKVSKEGGDTTMSTATKLIEQGKKEGIKEGEKKGEKKGKLLERQNILIYFLKQKFGKKITDEDCAVIKAVSNIKTLKSALDAVLNAKTKKEVLDTLK